jgi:hypothetical protein
LYIAELRQSAAGIAQDRGSILVDRHRAFRFRARFFHGRYAICDKAKPRAQRQKKCKLGVREGKIRIHSRGLPQQRRSLRQRFFAPAFETDHTGSLTKA